jgi:hypothetical protein
VTLVRGPRARLPYCILALLFAWPPIHMGLSRHYRFSTWRYAGMGMYAAPDGAERDVYVFLPACARPDVPTFALTPDRKLGFYYLTNGPRLDLLALPELKTDEHRALASLIKTIKSLNRPSDFDRLARWADERFFPGRAPATSIGILLTEPHVDMAAGTAHAEAFGFVREQGRWTKVDPMRGPAALSAMASHVGACP